MRKTYGNFVRPSSPENVSHYSPVFVTGDEARRMYLDVIQEVKEPAPLAISSQVTVPEPNKARLECVPKEINLSNKQLFLAVQNNNLDLVKQSLDRCPERINKLDEYGWSLLMIGCQANAVEVVKELLKHNVNTSVRDKAGNSASSIVIKNKNLVLADLLISHKNKLRKDKRNHDKIDKVKLKDQLVCEVCNNNTYPDKNEHLSSTIHNINASRGKRIPTNYLIPESNKGFQLMLKVGWDKESGLGPDGTGNKYPIKAQQKKDRKGLGHVKMKETLDTKVEKHVNRKLLQRHSRDDRQFERNFRRQFY